jgi:hypothetical protein
MLAAWRHGGVDAPRHVLVCVKTLQTLTWQWFLGVGLLGRGSTQALSMLLMARDYNHHTHVQYTRPGHLHVEQQAPLFGMRHAGHSWKGLAFLLCPADNLAVVLFH